MYTLIVKHLPKQMSSEKREELLKHFGAKRVHCFSDEGKMKQMAIAYFPDESSALVALRSLHQLKVLQNYLSVEFWRGKQDLSSIDLVCQSDNQILSIDRGFKNKLDDFYEQLHHLSPKLGLHFPADPLIKYDYPSATPHIVRNIAKALMLVPSFYTQVLHLMNKMHLPPPFINTDYEYDELLLPRSFCTENLKLRSESSESELDSEHEQDVMTTKSLKQPLDLLLKRKRKISKVDSDKFKESTVRRERPKKCHPEFEGDFLIKSNAINIKEIHLPSSNSTNQVETVIENTFGKFQATGDSTANSTVKPDVVEEPIVLYTDKQLDDRVSLSDIEKYPIFKNYSTGQPSCRLYVKNLAKKVTESDLKSIFGRFVSNQKLSDLSTFYVKLLKGGRMHGQAFITFPEIESATQALQRTNGLLLNGKPIVVCYARSAQATVESTNMEEDQR